MNDLLITDVPGFTPQIGRLVSMLNQARAATLAAVEGLQPLELDHLPDPAANSIGALLLHIAAAEVGYQAATFHERELNDAEKREWGAVFALGDRARSEIRGHELAYYLSALERVRAHTLAELARRDDGWLDAETTFAGGRRVNNHYKWFHVLTHEVNHRGQIRHQRSSLKAHATRTGA